VISVNSVLKSVVVLVMLMVVSCASPSSRRIEVAAATSLAPVMNELLAAYTSQTGIQAVPILGSSGKLAQQIANGAPYDVFMSANRMYVERLTAQDALVASSRRPYARGVLVLAVNKRSGLRLHRLADLAGLKISRIAIANPELAPYGYAAKQALQKAGLWSQVQKQLVLAENVRQATQFVETGNAPVGLVALSTVDPTKVEVIPLSADLYDPIVQEAAIVSRTFHRRAAKAFIDFLGSERAQAILARHGFRRP